MGDDGLDGILDGGGGIGGDKLLSLPSVQRQNLKISGRDYTPPLEIESARCVKEDDMARYAVGR